MNRVSLAAAAVVLLVLLWNLQRSTTTFVTQVPGGHAHTQRQPKQWLLTMPDHESSLAHGVGFLLIAISAMDPATRLIRHPYFELLMQSQSILMLVLGILLFGASMLVKSHTWAALLLCGGLLSCLMAHRLTKDQTEKGRIVYLVCIVSALLQAHQRQSAPLFSTGFLCLRLLLNDVGLPPLSPVWLGTEDRYSNALDNNLCVFMAATIWAFGFDTLLSAVSLKSKQEQDYCYYLVPFVGSIIVPTYLSLVLTAHKGYSLFWKHYCAAQFSLVLFCTSLWSFSFVSSSSNNEKLYRTLARLGLLCWSILKLLDLPTILPSSVFSFICFIVGASVLWLF
jgi:hypothetical protein